MKTSRRQALLILIALSLLVVGGLALAQNVPASQSLIPASQTELEGQPEMQTANYCQTCHSTGDPQLLDPTAWRGGTERTTIDSCPVVTRLHEEINYTERLLLAIDRARAELPDGPETASLDARLAAADQTYSRLLDAPVTSLDATVSEAQSLRFRLGKIYTQVLQAIDEAKKERVLLFAGLVTLILLVSLGWGLYNTQKTARGAAPGRRMPFILSGIALALLVFAIFTLPLLRVPSQQTASASTDISTALDTAQRLADTAERADDRAWMFSRIAAAWNELDPEQAETVLEEALQAAQQAEQNTFALWGEAASALEAAIGDPASLEKAGLIADQLNATRARAWALRLIAGEWSGVDPQRAKEILEMAVNTAESGIGLNRDLDLRGIAVEMANLDSQRGLEIARMVADPALRAWGLREIGALTKDPAIFAQAVESARQIESPARRAEALRKIGQLTQDTALFQEAYEALNGLEGPALAYALSDLAAASGDASLVQQIDPAYP